MRNASSGVVLDVKAILQQLLALLTTGEVSLSEIEQEALIAHFHEMMSRAPTVVRRCGDLERFASALIVPVRTSPQLSPLFVPLANEALKLRQVFDPATFHEVTAASWPDWEADRLDLLALAQEIVLLLAGNRRREKVADGDS